MDANFDPSFLFGVATASFQIEGATGADGRGRSIWDRFVRRGQELTETETADLACDHYHRFREDIALVADVGIDAYRFSIAWPRVVPKGRGPVNARGLDFYDRLVDELLERSVQPWACLYHWDLPEALQDGGGWANRDIVGWYADYAVAATRRLGDRLAATLLFHDPTSTAILGHLLGRHAPGLRDLQTALAATHHINLATAVASEALRAERSGLTVGTSVHLDLVVPATDRSSDTGAAERLDALLNRAHLDPLLRGRYPEALEPHLPTSIGIEEARRCLSQLDFVGVSYNTRLRALSTDGAPLLDVEIEPPEGRCETTDDGREVFPDGLTSQLLTLMERYDNPPTFVTGNGALLDLDADNPLAAIRDRRRVDFIRRHLDACAKATARGVDLRGYFVSSLLDGYEWEHGYRKGSGLVHVDRESLKRTPKDSFHWYGAVSRGHGLPA